jgi:Lrp/AsnC family leucine-responsive transcriptional regulator
MEYKLDLIDKKILYELDKNSAIPINRLAKKLKLSKDRINYRIKNLKKSQILTKFVTQINSAILGFFVYKIYLKFQNLSDEKNKEIINWTTKNPNIFWVAESQGKWDLNITIFAKDINEFDKIISDFTSNFGKFISQQEINTTLKVGVLNKEWILPDKKHERKLEYFFGQHKLLSIDKTDIKILKILANNSRINSVDLAGKLNLTPRIVRYRIKELEKKGIILGYSISINYEVIKKQFFKANIYFNFLDDRLKQKIESYCKSRPNIIYFIYCIGSWPLEIEFNVSENKEFYEEINEFRKAFPEMKNYDTTLFTKEHKFDWMPECYSESV